MSSSALSTAPSDEEILVTLSQKSGVDFRNTEITEVELFSVSECDSGIRVTLTADKSTVYRILQEIEARRGDILSVEDEMFAESWKELITDSIEYYAYMFDNGTRKYAKSLNRTRCFIAKTDDSETYIINVRYAGD